MSSSIALPRPREAWTPPPEKPFDQAVWQAWVAKGFAQERLSSATYIKAAECVSIAVLLSAAALWSQLAPYAVVVRFVVVVVATAEIFQALHSRRHALAALFAGLALLYNPVLPVFSFSGGWQRVMVVASAAPFAALLAWRNTKKESQ